MSRLHNVSRNSIISLAFFVITTGLNFLSRKVMLDYLGTDLLGLNTTLNAIIDFMLLMELGVTGAIAASLYKPLADNDNQKINEIVWLIKHIYRLLALIILVVGILISPFLVYIVGKSDVTLWQTFIAYFSFLTISCSSYYFGYGRVLFQADQRVFIPTIITNTFLISKILIQICVLFLTGSYWWWLGIEFVFQVGAHYTVKKTLYRKYKDLEPTAALSLKVLIKRYTDIFSNAKRIAVHNMAGFVLRQSDNIVIATMINLSTVALYGNYYLINSAANNLVWNVFYSSWSSVGNLVATETKERIYLVYKEYLVINFFIVVVINLSILFLVEDLIVVWLGSEYLLSYNIVMALVGVNIVGSLTNASAAFLGAYKLFNDIWVPILESVFNIILSVIGAYYFGLVGVVVGTFATVFISAVWKPYYLHKCGIKIPMTGFLLLVAKLIGILALSVCIIYLGISFFREQMSSINNFGSLIIYAIIVLVNITIVMGSLLYLCDKSFRLFVSRIKRFIIR